MKFNRQTFVANLLLAAFLFAGSFSNLATAQNSPKLKKRVAVLTFEDKTSQPFSYGFVGKDAGDAFAEMLTTALVKSGEYIVIERNELNQLLQEQAIGAAGITTQQTAVQAGQVLGAELVVFGVVSEFGFSQQTTDVNTRKLGVGLDNSKATVAVDVRIVDPATSEIIAAEDIRESKSKKGVSLRTRKVDIGSRNKFDESIVGKAARDAVDGAAKLLSKNAQNVRWQAKVITMNGGDVFINAGEKSGVQVGNRFAIYRAGEALIDPDTGLNLGSVESKIGEVEVVDNQVGEGKAAKCRIVDGSNFERGDLVRMD